MKKILFIMLFMIIFFQPLFASAETLPQRLAGRIVLQVQANGEAWYIYPVNRLRYFLGRPSDAFQIMRQLGLGISELDYEAFKNNPPTRLLGRIVLRVHANGEAYYVDPVRKELNYLGRPDDAFRIMREKGLGVDNENISHLPIAGNSIIPPGGIMNITIDEPDWNNQITSEITVSGQARVFENTVIIRLRNSNDRILVNTFTTANSPDIGQFGGYTKTFAFANPGTTTGYLEVFNQSAKDGSEINKVISLVRF